MEMLIVVAIIVILLAIAIPSFNNSLHKARTAADEANVRSYFAEVLVENMTNDGNTFTKPGTGDNVKARMESLGYTLQAQDATVTETGDTVDTYQITYTNKTVKDGDSFVVGGDRN